MSNSKTKPNSKNNNEIGKGLKAKMEQLKKIKEIHGQKKIIINCGLLKAGKSTLFNALANKSYFDTDVVRATVLNTTLELENYIFMDTPGLDANDIDTAVAFEGYKNADILLFVHNSIDGELSKIETSAIEEIGKLFGNVKEVLPKCILVLTNSSSSEKASSEDLKVLVQEQCIKLFGEKFGSVVAVDSITYIKGCSENKQLLIEASNINSLKELIDSAVSDKNHSTVFDMYIKSQISGIKKDIEKERQNIEETILKAKSRKINNEKLVQVKSNIAEKVNDVKAAIDKSISEGRKSQLRVEFGYNNKDYREYSSEYKAKAAARVECERNLRSAISATKSLGVSITQSYREYFYSSDGLNKLKNELINHYNEVKQQYYSVVNSDTQIKPIEFNIKNDSRSKDLLHKIDGVINVAKCVSMESFSSIDYYLTRYSSNLDLDYNYRTEHVSGLFGSREKEVCYYKWDIQGATDDIKDSAQEVLEGKINFGLEYYYELARYNTDSFYAEFKEAVNNMSQNIDKEILEASSKNVSIDNEIKNNISVINLLDESYGKLERL